MTISKFLQIRSSAPKSNEAEPNCNTPHVTTPSLDLPVQESVMMDNRVTVPDQANDASNERD